MKVRLKITLCMVGLLCLLFGLGGSGLIALSFQAGVEREQEAAFQTWERIVQTLQLASTFNLELDYQAVNRVLGQMEGEMGQNCLAFRLSSQRGYVYASREADQYCSSPQPAQAGTAVFRVQERPDGGRYLLVVGTVSAAGDQLTLTTAHPLSAPYATRQTQQAIYLRVFLALALLCALLSYSLSRWIAAPLERLSQASRAIASGDFSCRVGLSSSDEIGAVARDFDAMAGRMEQTVEELRQSVEQRERFMGSFAHELKNPMTSIIGYAGLIREDQLTPAERLEAASYLVQEGKRLEGLSHKLLALFGLKREGLTFTPVSPGALIREIAGQLAPICAAKAIRLDCRTQPGTCLLERALVRSLLLNLLDNAQKAMDQGGTITVIQEMLPEGCRIQVLDEGRGIPPEALPHLTEAFYRVDKARAREQGGAGLGLALCREIVQLHHGSLSFANRPEGGAWVTVVLRGGSPCPERETSC